MKRVIDSSAAFKWVVVETDSDKSVRLRDDFRAGIVELIAPDIFPAEMASSFLTAQRKGRISDFVPPLTEVMSEGVALHPTIPLLSRMARIISAVTTGARFSVYDCLYVALAESERCELVTADRRLINNLGPHFPFIMPLSSLP
jgi:predicted nucleic acid-binding protein